MLLHEVFYPIIIYNNLFKYYKICNSAQSYGLPPIYIKSRFPSQYFGRLVGILRLVAGITSAGIIGLATIPKNEPDTGFPGVFIGFITAGILSLAFPINGFVKILRKK